MIIISIENIIYYIVFIIKKSTGQIIFAKASTIYSIKLIVLYLLFVFCYVMFAMLCYAMLCYAMLCYAMLCYAVVIFSFTLIDWMMDFEKKYIIMEYMYLD